MPHEASTSRSARRRCRTILRNAISAAVAGSVRPRVTTGLEWAELLRGRTRELMHVRRQGVTTGRGLERVRRLRIRRQRVQIGGLAEHEVREIVDIAGLDIRRRA